MRGGTKQHRSWKLDDERRKRSVTLSVQASPTTTHNSSPGNYTHERIHTGIMSYDIIHMLISYRENMQKEID